MTTNTYQYPNKRRHEARKETKTVNDMDVNGLSNQIVSQVLQSNAQQVKNNVDVNGLSNQIAR